MKRALSNAWAARVDIAGAACIVYGVSLINTAAAWVVAGLVVVISGLVPRAK